MLNIIDAASRPLVRFPGPADLSVNLCIPVGQLTLSGPSEQRDPARWPARGDLAHVRLAGRCFVPYYAVPMPHRVMAPGTALRKSAHAQADLLQVLGDGDGFDVLDMSGGWCWGQVAGDGFVGYVPHDLLIPTGEVRP